MDRLDTTAAAQNLLDSMQAWHLNVAAGVGVLLGLVLWLVGGRLIKPTFAMTGILLGAALGFFGVAMAGVQPIGEMPAPILASLVGALVGLIIAIILFRFAMAIAGAVVLGLVGAASVAAYVHGTVREAEPRAEASARIVHVSASQPEPQDEAEKNDGESGVDAVTAIARQITDRALAAGDEALARAEPYWNAIPIAQRTWIAGGWIGGVLLGLLFGALMPQHTSALIASMVGSAMWIPSAGWIATAASVPGAEHLDQPVTVWLAVWLGATIVGVSVQWIAAGRRATRAAAEA